jgi:V8-like Glu-specific endopeptidase
VYALGHPKRLPLKYTDHASVQDASATRPYFTTELDILNGNSGSPVCAKDTHLVEGVVYEGAQPSTRSYVRGSDLLLFVARRGARSLSS